MGWKSQLYRYKSEMYLSLQDFAEMEPEWAQAEGVKAEIWFYCFI